MKRAAPGAIPQTSKKISLTATSLAADKMLAKYGVAVESPPSDLLRASKRKNASIDDSSYVDSVVKDPGRNGKRAPTTQRHLQLPLASKTLHHTVSVSVPSKPPSTLLPDVPNAVTKPSAKVTKDIVKPIEAIRLPSEARSPSPEKPSFAQKIVPNPELDKRIKAHKSRKRATKSSVASSTEDAIVKAPAPRKTKTPTPNPNPAPAPASVPIKQEPTPTLPKNPPAETSEIIDLTLPSFTFIPPAPKNEPFSVLERYTPKSLKDFVGHDKQVAEVKTWLADFKARKSGTAPAILLSGPPGIGKTTLAHLILKQAGFRVIELNASEDRSRGTIVEKLLPALTIQTGKLFGKPAAVVLDEIDGMTGDNGGLGAVVSLLKGEYNKFRPDKVPGKTASISSMKKDGFVMTKIKDVGKKKPGKKVGKPIPASFTPVICIANVAYSKKMVTLRNICKEIKFSPAPALQQRQLIERVLEGEGYDFDAGTSVPIAEAIGSADFRHILIVLGEWLRHRPASLGKKITIKEAQALVVDAIDKDSQSIFACATRLLNGGLKLEDALVTYSVDPFMIGSMIMQNYPDYMPRIAQSNKTPKQQAAAQSRQAARLAAHADLYSDCDRFESYSHHGQLCLAYGTSVLAGAPPEPGLLKSTQNSGLQTLAFPEFALSRAQQNYKRLPLKFRNSIPAPEMGLIRFKLPIEATWDKKKSKDNKVSYTVTDVLQWSEHYRMDFVSIDSIDKLTKLGPNAKAAFSSLKYTPRVAAFGGKGKSGLQALMRDSVQISADELAKRIDEEMVDVESPVMEDLF